MAATSPPPNVALFAVLGIGAFYMLTQNKARAGTVSPNGVRGGVRSPAGGAYSVSPARAGQRPMGQQQRNVWQTPEQQQAARQTAKQAATAGIVTAAGAGLANAAGVFVRNLFNGTSSARPTATAPQPTADRPYEPFEKDYPTGAITTAADRPYVPYEGDYSASNVLTNDDGSATAGIGYQTDAAAINPAPGSVYSQDIYEYEYTVPEEIPAEFYDYG